MTGNLVRAFESILRILLITVAVSTAIYREIELANLFDRILIAAVVLYAISAGFQLLIEKSKKDIKPFMPIVSLICVIGMTAMLFKPTFEIYKLAIFIGFIAIWITGSDFDMRSDRIGPVRNRFIVSVLFLVAVFFVLFSERFDQAFSAITVQYFPIYGLIGLLYLNLVNMRTAYELNSTNTINKTANVKRFSGIAAMVAISLIVIVRTRLFGLWEVTSGFFIAFRDLLIKIIEWIVYPLAYGMSYLVELINVARMQGEEVESQIGAFDRGERLVDYDMFIEEYPIPPGLEVALTVIAWLLVIVIAIFMITNVYKKVNSARKVPQMTGTEERIFIFDDLNLFKRKQRQRSKHGESDVSKTRKLYKNALITFREKGFEKPISLTPNEYVEHLKSVEAGDTAFESLTDVYNKVRYGDQKDS